MKKAFFTLTGILCSLSLFAQPLDSFYKQGTSWVNIYHWTWSYPISQPPYSGKIDYVEGYKLHIGEDTVLNGTTYKKVYYTPIALVESTDTQPYQRKGNLTKHNDQPAYMGRIRIDNRKIYFTDDDQSKQTILGTEKIMYDFNGGLGDSVDFYLYPYRRRITQVDSIQLNTGNYAKRYYYNNSTQVGAIEGIGSVSGTLPDLRTLVGMKPGVTDLTTVCYTSGNTSYKFPSRHTIFDWSLMEYCFDANLLSVEEKGESTQLSIYPNPSNGNFTIEGKSDRKDLQIVIYNTLGQAIYSHTQQVTNGSIRQQLSLSHLPAGIYRLVAALGTNRQSFTVVIE